ncbi:hypothetical protein [Pseudoalteromonas sp. ASV78]|uniref:hypothetical protein n=1 Tax=Pseudoalteromonas sp. ASV78 TaxID=3397851 RepID=UPI0039FDC710
MRAFYSFKLSFTYIFLMVFMMFNFGCTYEGVYSDSDIILELNDNSDEKLYGIIENFTVQNGLTLQNESRKFHSGLNTIIYEIINSDGHRLFKISGVVGETQYVISAYEVKSNNSEDMFKSLFHFVKESFPDQKIEIKRREGE